MSDAQISLCIPAYKAEHCLPVILESALGQTKPFREIFVCVDACPGDTAAIARNFPVKVIVNDVNQGCSASKNNALAEVTTEWVHFHDADDLLCPDFVEEASLVIKQKEVDVIAMGYEYVDRTTSKLIARSSYDRDGLERDPVRYCIINKIPNFAVYRTLRLKEVGGFDLDPLILYNEDVAFHLKLATAGFRFTASNKVTSINYRYENSMSQTNQLKCARAHFEVMKRNAELVGCKYGQEIATKLWEVAGHLVMYNENEIAIEAIKLAQTLDSRNALGQSLSLRLACGVIGPVRAYRLREFLVRKLKPQLRPNVG
ncbi:MAG: glycosyltransferase family 2 protein [Pirellula sp.]|jgi:glycosyltransferase involved in cell wall biosynthesis